MAGPEEPSEGSGQPGDPRRATDEPAPAATSTKEPDKKKRKGPIAFLGELPVLLLIAFLLALPFFYGCSASYDSPPSPMAKCR